MARRVRRDHTLKPPRSRPRRALTHALTIRTSRGTRTLFPSLLCPANLACGPVNRSAKPLIQFNT